MKTFVFQIVSALFLAALLAGDVAAQLPEKGQELVGKLAAWEAERRENLAKEIAAKRVAVVNALKEQMIEMTKLGDLESAITYKVEIDRLEAELEKAAPAEEKKPLPRSERKRNCPVKNGKQFRPRSMENGITGKAPAISTSIRKIKCSTTTKMCGHSN